MFKSAFWVSILAALGTAVSLLNQLVLARFFGTTGEMDSYLIAISIPLTITSLASGVFNYQLVPAMQRADVVEGGADALTRSLVIGIGGASVVLGVAGAALSSRLIEVMSPSLSQEEHSLSSSLAHISWLCLPLATVSSIFTARLHTRQKFSAATILISAPMAMALLGCLIAHAQSGIKSAVVGQALGYLVMFIGLRVALGRIEKGYTWSGFSEIIKKAPLALGAMAVFVIFPFSDAFWGSRIGPSAVSYLGFAQRVLVGLSGLAIIGAATVLFPRLAKRAANGQGDEMRRDLGTSIRVMLICMAPIAVIVLVLAKPTVRVIFERGAFLHSDTLALSDLMRPMLVGMVAMSCVGLLFKGLFAQNEVGFASFASLCGALIYVFLSGAFAAWLGVLGIGYAYACTWWTTFLICCLHIWAKEAPGLTRFPLSFVWQLMVLSCVSGLISWAGLRVFNIDLINSPTKSLGALVVTGFVAFTISFSIGRFIIKMAEVEFLWKHASKMLPGR